MNMNDLLNDEKLNTYIDLLNRYIDNNNNSNPPQRHTYCSDTFLIPWIEKMRRLGTNERIVPACLKFSKKLKLEQLTKWIIPIHTGGIHWKLLVVLVQCHVFIVYDSLELRGDYDTEPVNMREVDSVRFFIDVYAESCNVPKLANSPWLLLRKNLYRTKQNDTVNCGVYVLTMAELYATTHLANAIFCDVVISNIDVKRMIMLDNFRNRNIQNLMSRHGITYNQIGAIVHIGKPKSILPRRANGKHLRFLFDPLVRIDRERILVTARNKFYSNTLIWREKLFTKSRDNTDITSLTVKQKKGLSRNQLVWSMDEMLLSVLQEKTDIWFKKLINKYVDQKEIWIVSIIDPTIHTWRDQLIFERMILELLSCMKKNVTVNLCIVYHGAKHITSLGGGLCIPLQDYSPQSFEKFAVSISETRPQTSQNQSSFTFGNSSSSDDDTRVIKQGQKTSNKRPLSLQHGQENDGSKKTKKINNDIVERKQNDEDTSASENSDIEVNDDEHYDTDMELSMIGTRLEISSKKQFYDDDMDDYIHSVMCLNDSLYHLVTTFPFGFINVFLYDSVAELFGDFSNHIIPTVNIAMSTATSPSDPGCCTLREKILSHTGGQFIWIDTPTEQMKSDGMVLKIQKARNIALSSKTTEMTESSSEDDDHLLGKDPTLVVKNLHPLYEGEHISRSIHNISIIR